MFLVSFLIFCITSSSYGAQFEPKVGLFWGQNEAYNKFGKKAQEGSLKSFCDRGIYDVIILRGLQHWEHISGKWNSGHGQPAAMPALNFANHCLRDYSAWTWYTKYGYLICPSMGTDILHCQHNKVKILLDIGGLGYHIKFYSRTEALEFSKQIWFAFLGNWRYSTRTFGKDVVLDGINLSLHTGANPFMKDFVHDIRFRMKNDWEKDYLLTASPPCFNKAYSFFRETSKVFDRIFIDFTIHRSCEYQRSSKGQSKVDFLLHNEWFSEDFLPELKSYWFVLSASPFAKGLHLTKKEINELMKRRGDQQITFQGIILNDASFDAYSSKDGFTPSMNIYDAMGGDLSIKDRPRNKEPPACASGSLCRRSKALSMTSSTILLVFVEIFVWSIFILV